jgi:RimJ/RimL family protein N-acetyltransferase
MDIHTPRLLLDALQPADAEMFFAYRADPEVARFQGWCPADVDEARTFIAAQSQLSFDHVDGWVQRAIRLHENGELVGDIGLNLPAEHEASVEFGISIAPAHQGRGYARKAVRGCFEHVFGVMGRHRIQASVDPRNVASIALLKRLGMRQEAHHRESLRLRGEWVDDMIFAMLKREWPSHQTAGSIAVKL